MDRPLSGKVGKDMTLELRKPREDFTETHEIMGDINTVNANSLLIPVLENKERAVTGSGWEGKDLTGS